MDNPLASQPWYVNVGVGAASAFALSMIMANRAKPVAKAKGDAIGQFAYQMGTGEGYNTENDQLDTSGYPDDTATGEGQGGYADDELGTGDSAYDLLMY